MANPNAAHAVLILLTAEVREVRDDGELGEVVRKHDQEFFRFDATDKDSAIALLSELIDKLKKEGFHVR